MNNDRELNTVRKTTNLLSTLLVAGFVFVGVGLLVLSSLKYAQNDFWIPTLLAQVGGLLVATGVLTVAWELVGKRAFMEEILSKAQLRADVVNAGLERVTDQYLQDVEWEQLFRDSRKLDIVVAYATTWRNTHRGRLETLARKPGNRLRVFLPNPDDETTMKVLGDRFKMEPETLAVRVKEAIQDFQSMGPPTNVKIYLRSGDALFSCYRFDRQTVITLYSHSQERRGSVPTFLTGTGMLTDFVDSDIEAILKQSKISPRLDA